MGWVVIAAWAGVFALLVFGIFKCLKLLRVPLQTEVVGIDYLEHSEIDFTGKGLV